MPYNKIILHAFACSIILLYGRRQQNKYVGGQKDHSETWCWNDEVAKAIEEKRRCYKIWHKTKTASDRNKYKEPRQNARRSVALAQEDKARAC